MKLRFTTYLRQNNHMAIRYFSLVLAIITVALSSCVSQTVPSPVLPSANELQNIDDRRAVAAPLQPLELGVVSYKPEVLISTDLINAITQLRPYSELETVFRIPLVPDEFMIQLESRLLERGYQVDRVNSKTGERVLMSSVVRTSNADPIYTYMVAIDRIAIKRNYRIGEDRVLAPVSSLYIRGASPSSVALNDALFLDEEL